MDSLTKALRLWPWLAAIASGLMYRACFAPFDQAWFCWIALTPLSAAVWFSGADAKRRWRRNLLLGYVAGLAFFWPVFSWLTTVTVPGWILVGLYMAIYSAAFAWLCGMLQPGDRPVVEKPLTGLDAVTRRIAEKKAAAAGVELPTLNQPSPLSSSPWLSSFANLRARVPALERVGRDRNVARRPLLRLGLEHARQRAARRNGR